MYHYKQLKKASAKVSDENFRFRCFLKQVDDAEVDAFVQAYGKQHLTSEVCNACQNCCRSLSIVYTDADIKNMSKALAMDPSAFQKQYLKQAEDGEWVLIKRPCPFLKEHACTKYAARPACCAKYPFLLEEGFVFRLYTMLDAVSVCPIVYDLFEQLKQKYAHEFARYLDEYSTMIG